MIELFSESGMTEPGINISIEFDIFWDKYDLKIGKLICQNVWNGVVKTRLRNSSIPRIYLNNEIRERIISHLEYYIPYTTKGGAFPARKHPYTYLNNACWEDEVPVKRISGRRDKIDGNRSKYE